MGADYLRPNTENKLIGLRKERSPAHFLVNYCPEDSDGYSTGLKQYYPLAYNIDSMFSILIPGDVVWLVSVDSGKVELVTRFLVSEIIDYKTACSRTKKRLFKSEQYLWSNADDIQKLHSIPFNREISQLSFSDGLAPDKIIANENGHFLVKHFWQIRLLSQESVQILENAYQVAKK